MGNGKTAPGAGAPLADLVLVRVGLGAGHDRTSGSSRGLSDARNRKECYVAALSNAGAVKMSRHGQATLSIAREVVYLFEVGFC